MSEVKKGCKGKKTPELLKRISDLLKAGNTRRTSAIVSGITETTFYEWMRLEDFAELVKRSEEEAIATAVATVKRAGIGGTVTETTITRTNAKGQTTSVTHRVTHPQDWKASAWYLERRRPQDWREKISVEDAYNLDDLTDEQLDALESIRIALAKSRDDQGGEGEAG